jgi:RNA polymerase sigma-70 factor (ECF subfamily)
MKSSIEDLARNWAAAQPLVASFISLVVPDFHDAQDVLQEVAASVLSHDTSRSAPVSFNAWVIGIARHKAVDFHRRRSGDKLVFDTEALAILAEAHQEVEYDQGPRREAMEHCLKRLAAKARRLVDLRYEDDLKPAEIARTMGSNVSAIKVALHRVRAALRECIEARLAATIKLP